MSAISSREVIVYLRTDSQRDLCEEAEEDHACSFNRASSGSGSQMRSTHDQPRARYRGDDGGGQRIDYHREAREREAREIESKVRDAEKTMIQARAGQHLKQQNFAAAIKDWETSHRIVGVVPNFIWGSQKGFVDGTVFGIVGLTRDVTLLSSKTGFAGIMGHAVQEFTKATVPGYKDVHENLVDDAAWNIATQMLVPPLMATFISIATDLVDISGRWPTMSTDERARVSGEFFGKHFISPKLQLDTPMKNKFTAMLRRI